MEKIGLFEKIHNGTEAVIMRLVPHDDVGPIFKWLFKIPILQYKLGMGWMIGSYIMLLTTIGRKSGKPRQTPLEYEYDRENDRYRIAAGWAGNTDWYKNLKANPKVHVQVGRRKFTTVAEIASDEEVAKFMMGVSKDHPHMDQTWSHWSDEPVDGTFESYVHAAKFFPSVWLQPITSADTGKGQE